MAEHKVPQDVEAEDKLLGPLSFRQFIYAMIAVGAATLAYFLATMIALPLLVIPLPVFLVFGVLAIPRQGQPMETYIGALIHFYFHPTRRLWNPDGQETLVEITNPPIDTVPRTKDISGAEASQRLSFLAEVEDTQGWSTRGNVNLADDYAMEANSAPDVFEDTSLTEELTHKLAETEQRIRSAAVDRMNTAAAAASAPPSGFVPPADVSFATPAAVAPSTLPATPIVTVPPAYAPASPPALPAEDEAALSAMLKQSAAQPINTFQPTVIRPTAAPARPTANPPTIATASPTTAAAADDPSTATPTDDTTAPKPDIMEVEHQTTADNGADASTAAADNTDDQTVEISLR